MGNEANCTVRFGKQKSAGKALLETKELIFRGDFRLKIPLSSIRSAKAMNGELSLETPEGAAVFALGAAAEVWLDKILHPKSRLDKLGVKPGAHVSLTGAFDPDFLRELRPRTGAIKRGGVAAGCDSIFLRAESRKDISQIASLAKGMKGATALWIVYPKGQKHITENDVLAAGRKAGLKDVKVVSFSATQTALKFVIPLSRR